MNPDATNRNSTEQDDLHRLLLEVYGDPNQRTQQVLHAWKELYALPEIATEFHVDEAFFTFWRRPAVSFVVVAVFNYRDEHLLIYSPRRFGDSEIIGWRLPGGPIRDRQGESLEEAARRVVWMETQLRIDELMPIAVVENTFRWQAERIDHYGLAFMARTESTKFTMHHLITTVEKGDAREIRQHVTPKDEPGLDATFTNDIPERMAFSNKAILETARSKLLSGVRVRSGKPAEPHPEVRSSRRLRVRLAKALHRFTVKKFLHFFASRPIRRCVIANVGQPSAFLDAAAGDDGLVCQIAAELTPKLCVANDISWRDMEPLRKVAHTKGLNIIFTNHNLDSLPFSVKFDVVLFKNALHHARSVQEASLFLESLKRVARRLIIVDVEQPRRTRYAKLFNWYYTHVLQDEGHRFLDWGQFKRLVQLYYGQAAFQLVRTIKGRYMLAVIDLEKQLPNAEPDRLSAASS